MHEYFDKYEESITAAGIGISYSYLLEILESRMLPWLENDNLCIILDTLGYIAISCMYKDILIIIKSYLESQISFLKSLTKVPKMWKLVLASVVLAS